jgi:hypothetical protein
MSWEGAPNFRWTKFYKGQRFRVRCEELNAPLPTREASYKLANAWWERKLAELKRPDPRTETLNRYRRQDLEEKVAQGRAAERILWAMSFDELRQKEEVLRARNLPPETLRALGIPSLNAAEVLDKYHPTERVIENAAKLDGKPVEKNRTISHQAERFLSRQLARGKSPATFADLRTLLKKAQTCPHLKPDMDVAKIDGEALGNFYV